MKSLTFLLLVVCTTTNAQRLHRSNLTFKHHYTGMIGGKYKFLMNLHFDEKTSTAEGEYRYYTQKAFLEVKGTYSTPLKRINLTESVYNSKKQQEEITGYFEGFWALDADTIKGKWFNKDRTKTFDFFLATDEKRTPDIWVSDNAHIVDNTWKEVDTIQINLDGGYKQLITGLDLSLSPDSEFITFEDINFDGHLDLLVLETTGTRNTPYIYWVYEEKTRKFIRHDELEATDPVIDLQHKRIVSDWTSSAAEYGHSEFIYQDGRFFLIEQSETDMSTNKTTVTKYKVENGKSVKIQP